MFSSFKLTTTGRCRYHMCGSDVFAASGLDQSTGDTIAIADRPREHTDLDPYQVLAAGVLQTFLRDAGACAQTWAQPQSRTAQCQADGRLDRLYRWATGTVAALWLAVLDRDDAWLMEQLDQIVAQAEQQATSAVCPTQIAACATRKRRQQWRGVLIQQRHQRPR